MNRCAHKYEVDITEMQDTKRRWLCVHCKNIRFEEYEHVCTYSCWLEHHPQEFEEETE